MTPKIKQTTDNPELKLAAKEYSLLLWEDRRYKDGTPVDASPYFIDGALWEATRHNSKAENLWQTLTGLRNAIEKTMDITKIGAMIALVDQCLIENRPTSIL